MTEFNDCCVEQIQHLFYRISRGQSNNIIKKKHKAFDLT